MEVHKPLVNLVDNMVTMGSLYGGDNVMLASQYKKVSDNQTLCICVQLSFHAQSSVSFPAQLSVSHHLFIISMFIHFTTMGQYTVCFDILAYFLKISKYKIPPP